MPRTIFLVAILVIALAVFTTYTSIQMVRTPIATIPPSSILVASSSASPTPPPQPRSPGQIPPQTDTQGNVEIIVQPKNIRTNSSTWDFEVSLNTHSIEFSQDLAQVSELTDDAGKTFKPVAWEGDPPSGHHRKGTLSFKPITPLPKVLTLNIRSIANIPVRKFQWIRQ